ncbi:MAG: N-6 DNA methylase [Sphingobacteriaceae bacterium]|nr:N-6 DNA methylase [Sphingobacteriaceae bacterium]
MLDDKTKKDINDCRDVLVGKVPDPKSQIEQITLALIYKFMDDMDREAVEKFKGKAKFFTGDFAKFGWRKLFDPSLSGKDMQELYSEALEKLQTNPNIPEFFRNIFKNAYLPYKDPATLKMFLKHINEFEYSHSEKLGDAFEYLLSVMGSQGDAGQFRTPRHIIDFIAACLNPQKNETVADPACGTAGFLLSAYKHILKQNTDKRLGDKLTPDQRKKLAENFVGYDISPDMVRLSLVNMYLHGFTTPKIFEYDTLSSEDRWEETFDVILANPPFMTPKGGIRPHKKFGVQANKAEVLFTDYIAEHLNKNGRAGIVVPNGIVATSQTAYKQLRKLLVDDSLIAVVSLPAGCFQPYSGVKTSILMLDKGLIKKSNHILFIKVSNDGFDLGAQRREHDKNDLPLALEAFNVYKASISSGKAFDEEKYSSICTLVEKEKVLINNDIVLSGDRYIEGKATLTEFEIVKISEVVDFKRGTSITKKDVTEGDVPVIAGGQQPAYYHNKINREAGAITISSSGAYSGFVAYHNYPIFASDCFTIASKNKEILSDKYLFHILKSKQLEIYEMQEGGGQPHIYPKNFDNWEIPLPPLEIQDQIVKEIEGYKKIIEGAKMVLDNYKPTITIKPEWEMVELGDVCEKITDGTHHTPTYFDKGVVFLSSKNVTSGKIDWDKIKYIDEKQHIQMQKRVSPKLNDVLLAKNGTTGVAALVDRDITFDIYVSLALLRPSHKLLPKYLLHCINSTQCKKQFNERLKGVGVPNLHLKEIKEVLIPLPSKEEQKQVVEIIESEQQLVLANKQLITIFEQKIKDKINEVWGVKEEVEA